MDDLRTLDRAEIDQLVARLAQNDPDNFRTGTTSPFPTISELRQLIEFKNCDVKFAKTYQLDRILANGGASNGLIITAESLGARKRLARLTERLTDLPILIKKVPLVGNPDADNANLQDVVIGARLNLLIAANVAPGFMRTVDWFICHDVVGPTNPGYTTFLYIVLGRQDMDIGKYLASQAMPTIDLVMSVMGQVLFNLESAQTALRYVHYDLHMRNVTMTHTRRTDLRNADFWQYKRPSGQSLWVSADDTNYHEAVIIDLGNNYMQTPAGLFSQFGERLSRPEIPEAGIRAVFHGQWDMRRFALNFIDHMVNATKELDTQPQSGYWQQILEKPVQKHRDFFQRLQDGNPVEYEKLMDVLQEMSGAAHVRIPDQRAIQANRDMARMFRIYKRRSNVSSTMSERDVVNVLTAFRNGGVRWYLERIRTGDRMVETAILYMWQWSRFMFPRKVGEVLDMPFFDDLRQKPRSGTFAMAAEFQKLQLHAPQRTNASCSNCNEEAELQCCETAAYCGERCQTEHWEEHKETHWEINLTHPFCLRVIASMTGTIIY